jgi:hypothetical protein
MLVHLVIIFDNIYVKNSNTLRLGFQNVSTQGGKLKEDNIRIGLQKFDFDIFGMAEMNVDWRMLKEHEKLPTRTKEWWEHQHVSWTHNRTFAPRQARQYGGIALFSVNKAAHRVIDNGMDSSNLGRWSWTRYKGKGSHTLRIFTAYHPNPPQGPFTVYAQHNAYFHSIQRDICPRHAFLVDLQDELKKAFELGDHIALMMDGNSNMKGGDLSSALRQMSLQEVILCKHGMAGPANFGYDEVILSDHRCLWVDLSFESAFGHNMPPLNKRIPKRLHCKYPRLVENFVRLYHQFASPLHLFNQVQELEQNGPFMSKYELIQRYEKLHLLQCEATAFAERHCCKLRTGQVAFSHELNASRLKIKAWLLLLSRAQKKKVSSRLLPRTLKKANMSLDLKSLQETTIQEELKEDYQNYYRIKGNARQLRATALENLAEALVQKGDSTQEKMLKALREREQQRQTVGKIRYLQGKLQIGSTTMVTTTDPAGSRTDITDQEGIKQAILRSNEEKFRQASHTPFYQSPLKDDFGFKGLTTNAQAALAGLYEPSQEVHSRILGVIAQWQIPQAVRDLGPLKMEMSLESYTSFWKKAKEDTSCYPSALFFSTMKAGATDPAIAALDCTMTRLPLQYGFAPQRWKHCLDVMIMKKSGV